jgi:hypothetical protein
LRAVFAPQKHRRSLLVHTEAKLLASSAPNKKGPSKNGPFLLGAGGLEPPEAEAGGFTVGLNPTSDNSIRHLLI